MAKYERFEDLPVWQEAVRLYNAVLDLLEDATPGLSGAFRNQLERAALSVSNNIAEGYERFTTNELLGFLAIARGSAGEVRSMIAAVIGRPKLAPLAVRLQQIRAMAESCARQLTGWTDSIEGSSVRGKRHLSPQERERQRVARNAMEYRHNFLRNLPEKHPLYHSREAREARGESAEDSQ